MPSKQGRRNIPPTPVPPTPAPPTLPSTSASSTLASSTQATDTATDILPKPSRKAWKTGVQLEYLYSQFPTFLDHQDKGKLSRFWPRIYDTWYKRWKTPDPTPKAVIEHRSVTNAILVLRLENNRRIRTWFHNKARPSSKVAKSDLKLCQNEKRKLAPAQAYCTYAWDSGLRDIVVARWEEQKLTYMSADDDDPPVDSTGLPSPGSHIPIDFKLKIAKEVYNGLSSEEKALVETRREEEQKKLYRSVPDITDTEERDKKLLMHKKNQPAVPKSLLRILKNLEDQAGCVAQLLVAHIDPVTGKTSCQKFCQGKTESGLDFQAFSGREFDDVIEKRFREWALRVFGDKESTRRARFLLSDKSTSNQGATSSSAPQPHTSSTVIPEQFIEPPTEIDTTMVDEDEITGDPLPQVLGVTRVVPAQNSTPPPPVDQPLITMPSSPGGDVGISMPPQTFKPPQFVSPQEIFAPPQSLETVPPSHLLESFQTARPNEAVAAHQTLISPAVTAPPPVIPSTVLGSSRSVTPNQIIVSPAVTTPPSLVIPSPVLEPSQAVTLHQVVSSVINPPPLVSHSPTLGSSRAVAPHQVVPSPTVEPPAPSASVVGPPQTVIHNPQAAAVCHSPNLTGGISSGNSGSTVTTTSTYRLRDEAGTTTSTRTRRDSIEGAPDIILLLGRSGYELATPSSRQEPLATFAKDDADTTTSTTPNSPPNELIRMEGETSTPATPSGDEFIVPSSQQFLEESLIIPTTSETIATSNHFLYAPRIIPDYNIDRSDFPSWLLESGRLDYVLFVEAGAIWKKLIATWLRQERRLGFGLNERLGASLPLKNKPEILKGYFKWYHNPIKGDSVALPGFGDEVSAWWSSLQPEWRYKDESSDNLKDYSYILAGGKKGSYLLILCLAWWDRAYGRNMELEKARRHEAARDSGIDDTKMTFEDLHDHEYRWFNIVNDLIFVMELAQGWLIAGEGTPAGTAMITPARIAPARKKRAAESGSGSSPRKKKKAS